MNKQLNKTKKKPQNFGHMEGPAQHNLPTPTQQKTRGAGQTDSQLTSWWEGPPKTQKQPKTKDMHRANINHSQRSISLGDQTDCPTESHRYSTTEFYTINPGAQNRAT